MADSRTKSVLAVAAELETRDALVASDLARIGELTARAGAVGRRAGELAAFLEGLPGNVAELEQRETAAQLRLEAARSEEASARERLAELEGARRGADRRAQVERELQRAGEAGSDATVEIERLRSGREQLLAEEVAAHSEARRLTSEAREVASAIRRESRVSAAGKAPPGDGLGELSAWADRAGTALLAARVGLDAEREQIVREASELGASVLGEALGGSSVRLVRRRLEQALGS